MPRSYRIVLQARMQSSRLPAKILAEICGRPLLAHVVERLRAAALYVAEGIEVSVATSVSAADDRTEQVCRDLGVACFRGSEEDVLARYLGATEDLDASDVALRATADNPLYCPVRTGKIIAAHRAADADYTSIDELSYVVPEVFRVGALREMARRAESAYCREHVTPYFRRNPEQFHVIQLAQTWEGLRPEIRLTVDTPEELHRMRDIYGRFYHEQSVFPLESVYEHCDRTAGAG